MLPVYGRKLRRQEESEATQTSFTGKRAFEHYLLCFQLVLWKQIRWLLNEARLPSELEVCGI